MTAQDSTTWLHIGPGRFHRAHQAFYLQKLNEKTGSNHSMAVVALNSKENLDQLKKTDGAYSLLEQDASGVTKTPIHVHRKFYFYPEDYMAVYALVEKPELKVISLTVTEKAYAQAEPQPFTVPTKTVTGLLVECLRRRKTRGGEGLVVLSCDNLSKNGQTLKTNVLALAKTLDPSLSEWISKNIEFPDSMVDRIVPKASDEASESNDIPTEKFSQWVIETQNPWIKQFEAVGVQCVEKLQPFEMQKLLILNASHSMMAYMGLLKGYSNVRKAIEDVEIKQFLSSYIKTWVFPALAGAPNSEAYLEKTMERFANPHVDHPLEQIAMDGSQKIQQRWQYPFRMHMNVGNICDHSLMALATWQFFLTSQFAKNKEVLDPWRDKLKDWIKINKTVEFLRILNPEIDWHPLRQQVENRFLEHRSKVSQNMAQALRGFLHAQNRG